MNEEKWLRRLAARARKETVPHPDVSGDVLAKLHAAASRADASVNAVALLDIYAALAPYFIDSALEEMRGPFQTILTQIDPA